jgi:hypothetical protein
MSAGCNPEWVSRTIVPLSAGSSSIVTIEERPLKIGTRLAFVARFLGRTLSYTYEVIDFIPNERLIMSTTEGPFRMETTYVWSDLSDHRTHMTLRNRGTPSGFASVTAPVMALAMRRANRKDLAALKSMLERQ